MSFLTAIVLGLVQGITEFLPISSSGHLAIAGQLLNMNGTEEIPGFFDVLLHLGTLAAVFVAYWEEIREMIAIAHGEGFSVMAHANGDATVAAAIAAGVDSIEHGAYLGQETLHRLAESRTVWVPTLVTIGNLIGDGRFPDAALRPLLAFQQRSVRDAAAQGAMIACGSDAGAYRVLHAQGGLDEQALLRRTLGPTADQILTQGNTEIQKRF